MRYKSIMSLVPGIVLRALRTGNDRKPLPEGEKAALRALVGDAGFKTIVSPSVLLPAKVELVKNTVLKAGITDGEARLLLKYVIDGVRTRALEHIRSGSHANKARAIELLSRERSRSRSRSRSGNRNDNGGHHQSKKKGPSASSRSRGVRGSGGHNGGGNNNNDDDGDQDGGRRRTRGRRRRGTRRA